MDEPQLIGSSIDEVLDRVLPEKVAAKQRRLRQEHAEQVRALWDHFREVCRRRLLEIALQLHPQYNEQTVAMMAILRFQPEREMLARQVEETLDVLRERLRAKLQGLITD